MKAAFRTDYGPPSVLQIVDTEIPQPGEDEVLVKIHYTTVNRTDCGVLYGKPWVFRLFTGPFKPRYSSTGTDFAGVVIKTGSQVVDYKPGDRVFGFNDEGIGSHRQYAVFSQKQAMAKIPTHSRFEDAVASIEGFHYAFNFLNKVELKPEDEVFINGVTGAIGSAAIQLVKLVTANISVSCAPDRLEWARSMGAKKVFDFTRQDFTRHNQQYDFIFDAVGKSSFSICRHLLKKGGVYISSEPGDGAENLFRALIPKFLTDKYVQFPLPLNISRSLAGLVELLQQQFSPLIDRIYPLEEIREAFSYVHSGVKLGNVLLSMEPQKINE